MRRRRQRGDDIEDAAILRPHLLAAGGETELDHFRDRPARRLGLLRGGKAGFYKTQQRLGVERVVIGRAVADLHRRPHRLGDAAPWRARDKGPSQIQQQCRVLVAARIEAAQRHQQFAAAHISIADQVERGIGRHEAVSRKRAQQMRAAGADHRLDLGNTGRAAAPGCGLRFGMGEIDAIEQRRHRRADRRPVRRFVVARPDQRLAQGLKTRLLAQLGNSRAAQ